MDVKHQKTIDFERAIIEIEDPTTWPNKLTLTPDEPTILTQEDKVFHTGFRSSPEIGIEMLKGCSMKSSRTISSSCQTIYKWHLDSISEIRKMFNKGEKASSPEFTTGGYTWYVWTVKFRNITICPNGNKTSDINHVSFYLNCQDPPTDTVLQTSYSLGVCNSKDESINFYKLIGCGNDLNRTSKDFNPSANSGLFSKDKFSWGWKNFISYPFMIDNKVLVNDEFDVFCVLRIHKSEKLSKPSVVLKKNTNNQYDGVILLKEQNRFKDAAGNNNVGAIFGKRKFDIDSEKLNYPALENQDKDSQEHSDRLNQLKLKEMEIRGKEIELEVRVFLIF
jgi:hypothetical protein